MAGIRNPSQKQPFVWLSGLIGMGLQTFSQRGRHPVAHGIPEPQIHAAASGSLSIDPVAPPKGTRRTPGVVMRDVTAIR
jgi:hypothetical protein